MKYTQKTYLDKMVLIGIMGKKQHGKDTIADHLIEKHGFVKYSFAGPLKESTKILFGMTDEQVYGDEKEVVDPMWKVTPRKILQFVGTELYRDHMHELIEDIGDNFWVQLMINYYLKKIEEDPEFKLVVPDARFLNEVNAVHKLGGTMIKVIRPGYDDAAETHASEIAMESITEYDHLVYNDSDIPNLYVKVDDLHLIVE